MILQSAFLLLILSSISTALDIPTGIFYLSNRNITSLDDLTGNSIHSLNLNLSNLETLILDNALRNFSGPPGRTYLSIGTKIGLGVRAGLYLPKLKKLYLRNNTIIEIVGLTEETVPNLTHLYLSDNYIEYLDFIDKLPKSITHLYLDNNKISKFVHERTRVESLGRPVRVKGVTEKYDFNHLENLKHLDMSYNKIEIIEDDTFQNSSKLISLRLNNNSLSSVPHFSGLTQIEELDLSYNNIRGIFPPAFNYLSSLKELKIFGNPESMDLEESDMECTS
ncbi:hypothetical protein KQX54_003205 [Cotesia glomerata]|uniref:Uncharacterized protein n=1 Tax=Cotesia glomerata TaxID=32391 RepID=A0AAV7J279_COTGL|nr:hypothetical protein KQX54_003205 [Cotesia glomerata]